MFSCCCSPVLLPPRRRFIAAITFSHAFATPLISPLCDIIVSSLAFTNRLITLLHTAIFACGAAAFARRCREARRLFCQFLGGAASFADASRQRPARR